MKILKHMAVAAVLAMPATAHAEMSDTARKITVQRACQAAIWPAQDRVRRNDADNCLKQLTAQRLASTRRWRLG